MSKKFKRATIGLLIVVLLAAVLAVPVFAASVTPELVDGNPSCTSLGYAYGFKPSQGFPANGTYDLPDGINTVTIAISGGEAGKTYLTWSSTLGMVAVIVKGGPNANLYEYDPPSFGDTDLHSPVNPENNKLYDISHVEFCYVPVEDYEELTVEKTADTSFTREHFWDITKKVETENEYEHDGFPKVWLYIDGSGDEKATWTVDVTYEGYDDSDWNVSGEITIENTGTLDAVITAVDDVLAGSAISVDCGVTFPYTLPVGETLTCTYDEDGYVEGKNEVTVTTEEDEYDAEADIVWGDPTTEINETVTIKDLSDLFGEVELGTVTAPNGDTFTYDQEFTWADYGADGCGDFTYDNEATIVETEQSASATLLVNVQCYVYEDETAYALGDDEICFIPTFANWGWTNPIGPGEYEWELWAAAGQCDTSKGTLVGTVTVVYDPVTYIVTVTFNVDDPHLLRETHVYVGYDQFPKDRRGRDTVAPGQYTNEGPFDGSDVYVIAHAVVGIGSPDPNFGP